MQGNVTGYGSEHPIMARIAIPLPESESNQTNLYGETADQRLFLTSKDLHFLTNFSMHDFFRVAQEGSNHWFSLSTECVLIFFFVIMTLFGLSGNALMCYIILTRQHLKSCRNWFILNLTISDILTCVLCIPFTVIRLLLRDWPLGEIMCKIVPTLQAVYVFVSTLTIVAIAIDRYRAIVYCSLRSPDKSTLFYVFPMIWMVSFALALPMFVYHYVENAEPMKGIVLYSVCMEKWPSFAARGCYTVAVLMIHYATPTILIVSLHILICKFIRLRIDSQPASSLECQKAKRQLLRHRKNIMLLTGIAFSFALTWFPWTIVNVLADFHYKMFIGVNFNLLNAVCHFLAMSSVCINPIVYGWFNSNFRREIKAVLFRVKRNNSNFELLTNTERKSSRFRDKFEFSVYTYFHSKTEN